MMRLNRLFFAGAECHRVACQVLRFQSSSGLPPAWGDILVPKNRPIFIIVLPSCLLLLKISPVHHLPSTFPPLSLSLQFLHIYLLTSFLHLLLPVPPHRSRSFPSISSHFLFNLLCFTRPISSLLHPTFCFFFPLLPTSSSLLCLSSILSPTFLILHVSVSQLKALSSSYRPVVSLCTIRSALALGFCNLLTSSLSFFLLL